MGWVVTIYEDKNFPYLNIKQIMDLLKVEKVEDSEKG